MKPAYEKAAKGLKDFAQVAAVNCDDESNKAFCGTMGVQGFPTLKIVKPSKKPGKPIVEDYQGPREAKGIIEAVKSAIPNNVKKVTDKGLSAWLDSNNETTKAVLFSEKGTTSPLIKVLALDSQAKINFAQIRNKDTAAVEMFGITEYPTFVVLPGGKQDPVRFDGSFTKDAMKAFLEQYTSSSSEASPKKQKPMGKESERKPEKVPEKKAAESAESAESTESTESTEASSTFAEASASHKSASASEEAAGATSVTLEEESNPTESPHPNAVPEDAPKPVSVPHLPEPIPVLIEQKFLKEKCLGSKTSTCVLALLPTVEEEKGMLPEDVSLALSSLSQLAEKHAERGGKLFPFFSIPQGNAGAAILRDALKLKGDKDFELIAVNARRNWWRQFEGEDYDAKAMENWVDNIRFGEGHKERLPDGLVAEEPVIQETVTEEPVPEPEEPAAPTHGEL